MSPKDNFEAKLQMTFTPNTIEHLGVRMYSTLPPVISELIANSYDANASEVHIYLKDKADKEIVVSDNGHGMSFDDINSKFLRIGRNRRSDEASQASLNGIRPVIGKKGLGKLSFFGIAHQIDVSTTQNGKRNSFVLNWEKILSHEDKDRETQRNYSPEILEWNAASPEKDGTTVILRDIQRNSKFDAESLADSIAKIFIIDPNFKIYVKHNDEGEVLIENQRKYSSLTPEIEWNVPEDIGVDSNYEKKEEIRGRLIATEKPISPKTNMRGITLFSRKKLVNLPEYFSDNTSSHFFSYLTGWLEVDFIDELPDDVIGTNRQSLNWDHPAMVELRRFLQRVLRWLEVDWRQKRSQKRDAQLETKTGLKISEWREHIPNNINMKLNAVIKALVDDAELPEEEAVQSLKGLQDIIKPYPYFHWQNLHSVLHEGVFGYYKNEDYYSAVFEGIKIYLQKVIDKTGSKLTDRVLLENIFSVSKPKLSVTKKFKKPNGQEFSKDTKTSIEEGHQKLVIAMWQAFRNPISHDAVKSLRDSGLYTEQDCLDALSLLSHLFRRLDAAE